MITSRHNLLVSVWRLIIGRKGVAATREPAVAESLHLDTERRSRSGAYVGILAILQRRLTVAVVLVIHPGADTYVCAAAATASSAGKLRDDQKYIKYNRSGSAVYTLVPLSSLPARS